MGWLFGRQFRCAEIAGRARHRKIPFTPDGRSGEKRFRSRRASAGGIFVAIGKKFVRYEPQPAS
jgi:hypothetical protein